MDNPSFVTDTYNKIADIYTNSYFNDTSDLPFLYQFLKNLPQKSKVLDVGCGPGTFTQHIFQKGFNVQGIDLADKMIRIAKKNFPNIPFQVMDMQKLAFADESFDALIGGYSLIHIPSKEIAITLSEFRRVLKLQGKLCLMVQKGEADKIVDEPLQVGEKIFVNFFTKNRLTNYLTKAKFKMVSLEEHAITDETSLSDTVLYVIASI